ncbi:MAG TPA: hypothetical protein VEH04_10590 [Verrucomicrobiae bacterium]|nr:hypothetical protein [Verrucomicrobiae bacterium]
MRRRYRLIDLDRLCWRLRVDDLGLLRRNLEASLVERIAGDRMRREPQWTESLAVGSADFVQRAKPLILGRRQIVIAPGAEGSWVLQESAPLTA